MMRLAVDGKAYEGWMTAQVERGLLSFAHKFSLTYHDRWAENAEPWQLVAGSACQLTWSGLALIDGYVERPVFRATGDVWQLSATGRSRTGNLVDCSAIHKTGNWRDKTAREIISDLCEPFGVSVSLAPGITDTERFRRFLLREGETTHAAMDRLCKVRGLLPVTTESGDVELWTSDALATTPPILLDVDSAIDRQFSDNMAGRYSHYYTKFSSLDGEASAVAQDTGVPYYRPLVVVGDSPAKTLQAWQRAVWEANVRHARGVRLDYVFTSPLNRMGRLYTPRQRYKITDPYLGIDQVMLLESVSISVKEPEVLVRLALIEPQALSRAEYDAKKLIKRTKQKRRTKRGSLL